VVTPDEMIRKKRWKVITKQRWTSFKKRLAFCELTQDGDQEGCFRLHGLPTPILARRQEIARRCLKASEPPAITKRERSGCAAPGLLRRDLQSAHSPRLGPTVLAFNDASNCHQWQRTNKCLA
jgi:hypothetical protein